MTRSLYILAAGCVCAVMMAAQAAEPMAAPSKAVWLTSFEAARTESVKRRAPILVDFSGSDWCGWCMKLEREVFSQPEFKDYAAKNLVLLLVDFPRRALMSEKHKKQNEALAAKYEVQGFPTVLLLDAAGAELFRTGYQPGGAARYVEYLKAALLRNKRVPQD